MQINAPHVSPDGKTVAFIGGIMSDFGSVGGDLYTVPLAGGQATDVTPGAALSVNSLGWFGRNDRLLFTALVGDSYALESIALPSGTMTKLWSAPMSIGGDLSTRVSLSHDGAIGAFSAQDFEHPAEIFAGRAGSFAAITHDNDAVQPLLRAVSVNWTNEGYHVQGWLLEPRTLTPGKTYPMITNVHGGPSAASTPYFASRGGTIDAIAHGYFVFLPNPRGSFGQGETFTARQCARLRLRRSARHPRRRRRRREESRRSTTSASASPAASLRRVHDDVGGHADQSLQGRRGRCRRRRLAQSYYGENGIDAMDDPVLRRVGL